MDLTILLPLLLFLFLIGIITKISQTAKYHVKYIGFLLYSILMTCFAAMFCLFHKPGSSENVKFAQLITKIMNFEWLFGIKIEVQDHYHLLNAKQPFVVISNHQTVIDALIIMRVPPKRTVPLAKKGLFYVPIFGQVLWLFGTVFIDRKNHNLAVDAMKKVGSTMVENMTSLWIFPEGSRYQYDKIMAFKKGAFHLAVQAQVPLVPIVIGNYKNVLDCHNKTFEGGVIRVKCLPPIETTDLKETDIDDLMNKTFQIISKEFDNDYKDNSSLYLKIK